MSLLYTFIAPHPPIIVPEIGRGEEKKTIDTIRAYEKMARMIAEIKPETIIVISPHSSYYSNYFYIAGGKRGTGDFGNFGASGIVMDIEYDQDLVGDIIDEAYQCGIAATDEHSGYDVLDHGVMVPLYFVNREYQDYRLVKVSLSELSLGLHYRFGEAVRRAVDNSGRRVVIIASGDLSHVLKADGPYGFNKEGPRFDRFVTDAVRSGDLGVLMELDEGFCVKAAECGLRSFVIMAGAIGDSDFRSELLSYEGPFGVGYAVAFFELVRSSNAYVRLARESLEFYLKYKRRMKLPEGLPVEMYDRRAGVFVSLKKRGELRGCVGTICGVASCVGEEIIGNAVSAGVGDPRFFPVELGELSDISFSVDVLGEAFVVTDRGVLDVVRFGVIVSSGDRRGLLLPDLGGVDTPEEQISIALSKAGIGPGEDFVLEAFEVVRYREE